MLIYTYGSNMLFALLKKRVPSCRMVSTGMLNRHWILFNKRGDDGYAKANAFYKGLQSDIIPGMIYEIDPNEKPILDRIESLGCGYSEKYEWVEAPENARYYVQFYVAMEAWIDHDLATFDWYKEYVVRGAMENNLPEDYIRRLKGISFREDPDRMRREEHFTVLTSLR